MIDLWDCAKRGMFKSSIHLNGNSVTPNVPFRYIHEQNIFVEASNNARFGTATKNRESWDYAQLGGSPWVGFKKKTADDKWNLWIDGKEMNAQTTRWGDNEPNNVWGEDNCAQMSSIAENKFLLNDIPCWARLDYLCEVQV